MNPPNSPPWQGSLATTISIIFISVTAIIHFKANATSSLQQLPKYEILHSFTGNAGYGFNGDTVPASTIAK